MLFASPTPNQVIALAGVFQACQLVETLATTGLCAQSDFDTCIDSLFIRDSDTTPAVFGQLSRLHTGLDTLQAVLGANPSGENRQLLRYVLGVMYLHRRLRKDTSTLAAIASGIDDANRQAQHFNSTHPNVLANLADLYVNTIGQYAFRIQVQGMPQHLQQPAIANRIRCLLFAGIRAALLWHQVGGRRIQLMLQRSRLIDVAADLRRQPPD